VKELFLGYGSFQLNRWTNIRFWHDIWVRNRSLKEEYLHLYRTVRHKYDTVATIFRTVPLNISFRRFLRGYTLPSWHELVSNIPYVRLNDEDDKFRCGLNQNGIFIVHSMYNAMIVRNIWDNSFLWKHKLPLKIKIFLWHLNTRVMLTKDNLVWWNWTESTKCAFCDGDETIQHMCFLIVIMLNFYGEHCRLLLIFRVQQVSMICLQIGYLC
jgi:hypothetical protein